MAAVSTEVKPERVGEQAGEHSNPKPQEGAELTSRGKRACSQQPGDGGQRNPHLIQKHDCEYQQRAVADEE